MTLIEKKDKGKPCLKNWRLISLLDVDTKIISKALATRLKKVIFKLVTQDQTVYIPGRYISESVRLISDILKYTDRENYEGKFEDSEISERFFSVSGLI